MSRKPFGHLLGPMLGAMALAGVSAAPALADCAPGNGLGVSRIVDIDAATGPLYGSITKYQRQTELLQPKEVVLTFDDGPLPWITKSILDTLDRYCTKATFFSVGRMAIAYPEMVRTVLARGHTLGTHTWSHPLNLRSQRIENSVAEIEKGFAAVAAAAGQPIAPFFRFPGLSDSAGMLSHLQSRNVATFTVDVVSNDSFINSVERLTSETIAKVEARKGGIMLFHDIKAVTARALPGILAELRSRGYRVVHMTSSKGFVPDEKLAAGFGQQLAKADAKSGGKKLMPFYGTVGPEQVAKQTGAPVVPVKPVMVSYLDAATARQQALRRAARPQLATTEPIHSAWVTTVRRSQRTRAQ